MFGLERFSGIFGQPLQGAHRPRVCGFAAVDLLLTGGLAFALTRYGLRRTDVGAGLAVFAVLIAISVGVHRAFGVHTRLTSMVFGWPWPPADAAAKKRPRPLRVD